MSSEQRLQIASGYTVAASWFIGSIIGIALWVVFCLPNGLLWMVIGLFVCGVVSTIAQRVISIPLLGLFYALAPLLAGSREP